MIKFDKDEFLKPEKYSTNDERETRCNVTKEIVDDVKQLQQENKKYKEVIDKAIEIISKELLCYDNESDEYIQGVKLLDILKEVK